MSDKIEERELAQVDTDWSEGFGEDMPGVISYLVASVSGVRYGVKSPAYHPYKISL